MARARNIKPGLFKNEVLGVADPLYTLAFQGLWVLADRDGRLEDRALRIKAEVFPYRDGIDMDKILHWMHENGFVLRYRVNKQAIIQIINFQKHQNPHKNETPSELPPPDEADTHQEEIGTASEKIGTTRADSLNLIPDSLIPDSPSLIPSRCAPPALPAAAERKGDYETALQAACKETLRAYGNAYLDRYGTAPVVNAKIRGQVKQFVQRIGHAESPLVAAFFLTHQESFYVKKCHDFGLALHDAEKLRTEWATRRMVTNTSAQQADRTGNMMSIVDEIMAERDAA